MPRPRERTIVIDLDMLEQLTALFATARNAYARLALTEAMPMATFYRAWSRYPISPDDHELIVAQWAQFQRVFLTKARQYKGAALFTCHPVTAKT